MTFTADEMDLLREALLALQSEGRTTAVAFRRQGDEHIARDCEQRIAAAADLHARMLVQPERSEALVMERRHDC